MANDSLLEMVGWIEFLCLENEAMRVALQEHWPTTGELPWQTYVSRYCEEAEKNDIHPLFDGIKAALPASAPPRMLSISAELSKAIEQSRLRTGEKLEQMKRTK